MSAENENNQNVLDCTGLACPQPVIMTKKALELQPESLTVLVDNTAAKENVAKFASANGYGVSIEAADGSYRIRLLAGLAKGAPRSPNLQSSSTQERSSYLITQSTLGHGSRELGAVLMKSFFVSLLEALPQPRVIMLLNSGVYLAAEESPVLSSMQELSGRGVSILVCGTCLDYFNLKDKLAVGTVTNMYSIVSELSGPGRAITL